MNVFCCISVVYSSPGASRWLGARDEWVCRALSLVSVFLVVQEAPSAEKYLNESETKTREEKRGEKNGEECPSNWPSNRQQHMWAFCLVQCVSDLGETGEMRAHVDIKKEWSGEEKRTREYTRNLHTNLSVVVTWGYTFIVTLATLSCTEDISYLLCVVKAL